jgi:gluconolactonase
VIADYKQGILELDPVHKEIRNLAARYHGERLKGPNDLVISSDGVIYFADQGMSGAAGPHRKDLSITSRQTTRNASLQRCITE